MIDPMKTLNKLLLRLTVCAASVSVLLLGCATVGETGRRQFMLVSQEQEVQLGISSFDQMKAQVPINRDPAVNALVQRVGKRVAATVNMPNAQWEFVVFQSPEANAFCLPGGKIGVYTGILPITQNEAGLATVIGHEVSHATARHGAERMSESMGVQMLGQLISGQLSTKDPQVQQGAMLAYGVISKVGVELPHSRKQESEADFIGLKYMARAGYDPEEAVRFWERFSAFTQKAGGASTPAFLRTHPLDATRIQQLKDWLPQAKTEFRPATGN